MKLYEKSYLLTRSYEHMCTNGNGEPSKEVNVFLDYMLSKTVQPSIVKDLGYLAVTEMKVEYDVAGNVTKK